MSQPVITPRRIAFVVSALTDKELTGGNRDAARIYDILTDPALGACSLNSPKPLLECENRAAFHNALINALQDWRPVDQLVFYFSGHGRTIRERYCLLMGNAQSDYLPFSSFRDDLQIHGVQRAIIILDACYSGAAVKTKDSAPVAISEELYTLELPRGIALLTSSRASETSAELSDGSASVFTDILCNGIRSGLDGTTTADGLLTIEDVVTYIRKQLETKADYAAFRQRPIFEINGADRQIWIAKNRSGTVAKSAASSLPTVVESAEQLEFLYKNTLHTLHPCEPATIEDLDWDLIKTYVKAVQPDLDEDVAKELLLSKLGLFSPIVRGGRHVLHKSAVLCFSRRPEVFYPQARAVFVAGSLKGKQFIREDVHGPLSRQVSQLTTMVRNHLDKVSEINEDGLREEVEEVDINVIRELISNAIIHRDYSSLSRVQVRVTLDAIEIISPGRFPENTSWNTFIEGESFSNPVDPAITMYVTTLRASEGIGRGFEIIKQYLSNNGSESITYKALPSPAVYVRILRGRNNRGSSRGQVASVGNLPPLPGLIVGRELDIQKLKETLGLGSNKPQTDEVSVLTAIRGWPGIGKTTLAAALAYDKDIARKFPDGVLWTSLGQEPNVLSEMATWGRALGTDEILKAKSIQEAQNLLAGLLRNKKMLLIIDDVWKAEDAFPFKVGGPDCAMLITTRITTVASSFTSVPDAVYVLGVLTDDAALDLLHALAPAVVEQDPDKARELVHDLEGLPLAIQVAGRMLNTEASYGFGVENLLTEIREGTKLLEAQAPPDRTDLINEVTPSVAVLLRKSTDRLNLETREAFAMLGAFAPKPATFDIEALKAVWQVEDARPMLRALIDRGLLEPAPKNRFQLHSLLVAHALSILEE